MTGPGIQRTLSLEPSPVWDQLPVGVRRRLKDLVAELLHAYRTRQAGTPGRASTDESPSQTDG